MDRKVLIIGGTGLLVAGAIATGAVLNNFDRGSNGRELDEGAPQALEDQNFKDFADESRYSFCQGREEIKGAYTNSTFGHEKGDIEYVSEDINVFDKEKNKLFILGRKIRYKYSGVGQTEASIGEGKMEIEENGSTVEYYSKFTAPVRIDYNVKMIYPAPERKKNDWVVIETKGQGTVMGFTDERVDKEMGDAKTFCPAFGLGSALITPEYFSFEKACLDNSSGIGLSFSGNFKFECGGIDNERGIEIAKEYKELEEARKVFDSSLETEDGEKNEFQDLIKGKSPDDGDMLKKLQQMRDEMKAEQRSQ